MSSIKYEVEVFDSGRIEWKLNGKLHREDGPATIDRYGTKRWYIDHQLHKLDGPAIESANGDKSWYIEGLRYTEFEFNTEITRRNSSSSCNNKVVEFEGKKYRLVEEV